MKKLMLGFLKATALSAVSGVALGLVMYSVLSSAGISFTDLQKATSDFRSRQTAELKQVERTDEVQSYSLFKTVKFKEFDVTTGIRYASNTSQTIEHQWCYITGNERDGKTYAHLTLASKTKNAAVHIPDFDATSLGQFDLTDATVQALITSHCRFQ